MIYADLHLLVRSGPYRGMYAVYERCATYEVLEDGLPEESGASDPEPTSGGVGTPPDIVPGDRPGGTDQGVPDGSTQEEGEVEDLGPYEPYNVQCARCGIELSCTQAVAEEGDEWECFPCWERLNEKELREREERPNEATPRQLPLL
jgi:hypothetical protein